ncbi:MAG: hypothetical protein AB8H86_26670 [Polyangiales bacterium]
MSCGQRQYGGIDRGEFDTLMAKLREEDIEVPMGDRGEISGPYGIEGKYEYREGARTLKIEITDKKFWVPCRRIWEVIDEAVTPHTK